MESADNCEKSLTGMSVLPRWMKRATERYDYSDICTSPPVDGIFHLNTTRHRASGHNNAAVECMQSQRRRSSRGDTSMDPGSVLVQVDKRTASIESVNPDSTNFFNSITTTSLANLQLASTQAALMILPGRVLNMNTNGVNEASLTAMTNFQQSSYMDKRGQREDSAATTPMETPSMILTNSDDGDSQRVVEQVAGNWSITPDVTPCSTPAVSPTCSPQVNRRSGNPFFTGGPASTSSGSWLFRPAQPVNSEKESNRQEILYEAKVEVQKQNSHSQPFKKTVRYVPRPSELRELNFWSPTSM